MAAKPNIRSIRMSDQVIEYINAQVGDNFSAKFEAMILRCMYELPAKEKQLKELEKAIALKRKQLYDMAAQAGKLSSTIQNLTAQTCNLEQMIAREVHSWEP